MPVPQDAKTIAASLRQEEGVDPKVREGLAQAAEYLSAEEARGIKSSLDMALKATQGQSSAQANNDPAARSAYTDEIHRQVHSLASVLVIGMERASYGGASVDKFAQPLTDIVGSAHAGEVRNLVDAVKADTGVSMNLFSNGWEDRVKASTALRATIEHELPAALTPPSTPSIAPSTDSARDRT